MSRNPSFIELEGHVIRIANIVRVSDESYISKEHATLADDGAFFSFENEKEAKQEKLKRQALTLKRGSWVLRDSTGNLCRYTYRARFYVRLRGSRDIYLYSYSSYEKLKEAMGL